MNDSSIVTYQRATVQLHINVEMKGIHGKEIRKAMIKDGLYSDPIAHNHGSKGEGLDRPPLILFRKGNKNTIVLTGINDGAKYLREKPLPIGKELQFNTTSNNPLDASITSATITQEVDYIRVGGFHTYETATPIIVAKSQTKMLKMLRDLKDDDPERIKLIENTIGRSVRRQIANFNNVEMSKVPHIRMTIDTYSSNCIQLKEKVSGIAVHASFGINVDFSGGFRGVGIGTYTSAGYGTIKKVAF